MYVSTCAYVPVCIYRERWVDVRPAHILLALCVWFRPLATRLSVRIEVGCEEEEGDSRTSKVGWRRGGRTRRRCEEVQAQGAVNE